MAPVLRSSKLKATENSPSHSINTSDTDTESSEPVIPETDQVPPIERYCFAQDPDLPIISTFNSITGDLEQFTIFPRLTIELRRLVWRATLQSRIIPLYSKKRAKLPIIFSVCSEGRTEALMLHKIIIEEEYYKRDQSFRRMNSRSPRNIIYFNPALDTIFLNRNLYNHQMISSLGEGASEIQNFAVSLNESWHWSEYTRDNLAGNWCNVFSKLENLKELVYVENAESQTFGYCRQYWSDLEEEITEHLKENFVRLGGKSDSNIPVVRILNGAYMTPW